jgi:hypothetical protein
MLLLARIGVHGIFCQLVSSFRSVNDGNNPAPPRRGQVDAFSDVLLVVVRFLAPSAVDCPISGVGGVGFGFGSSTSTLNSANDSSDIPSGARIMRYEVTDLAVDVELQRRGREGGREGGKFVTEDDKGGSLGAAQTHRVIQE